MEGMINLLCAFGGTVGFSILYNIDKCFYPLCGLTGMVGWGAYLLAIPHCSGAVSTLIGALVVVFMSRILSIWKKCPITVFLIAGIFPLIPGSSIYYAAYHFAIGEYSEAAMMGIEAVKCSFAIVAGIHLNDAVPAKMFQKDYWRDRFGKTSGHLQDKN